MKKLAKDVNVLSDVQVDQVLILLEAAWAETGNKSLFQILEILTKIDLNETNIKKTTDNE